MPFWKEIQELAAEHGVRVAIEMHPHNLVFNPATMKRLVELTTPEGGVNHVGAEMDPSHLFWQHIDPVRAQFMSASTVVVTKPRSGSSEASSPIPGPPSSTRR